MDAAQDGNGQAWALTGPPPAESLSIWQRNKWSAASIPPGVIGARPVVLGRGPDGSVLCLWQADSGINILTRHKGSQSSVMAHFRNPALSLGIQIFFDGKGNIWITSEGAIYRIYPESETQIHYSAAREQRHFYGRDSELKNPLVATPDGRRLRRSPPRRVVRFRLPIPSSGKTT